MRISRVTASFVARIEQRILASEDVNFALRLAQWLARFLTANFCGIYQFEEIEHLLAQKIHVDLPQAINREDCVHVASEVYPYGGHTRLMRNLLSTDLKADRRVVLTRPADPSNAASILDVQPDHIRICRESSERDRVIELAALLIQYRVIVLHIHPDDVIAAVAIAVAKSAQPDLAVHFVNHSDHTFSAAIGHADIVFEVSGYGWSLRAARGTESRSTYLGIPLVVRQQASSTPVPGRLLTGGSAYKYRPSGPRSLPRVLRTLMKREDAIQVVAIGPRVADFWWWPLKLCYPSRLTRHARIPHEEYVQQLASCSVYVDSYPVTGGTGFTEALIAGADVAGVRGGPNGYGLADALRSKNAGEFMDSTIRLLCRDPDALARQAEVRRRARELHAIDAVRARFTSALETGNLMQPPQELLCEDYEFDFRTEWNKRTRAVCAGFAGRRELGLLPTLLDCASATMNSKLFAIALFAKASVGAAREIISSRRAK